MLKLAKTTFLLIAVFVGGVFGQSCPPGTFPIFPSMTCKVWENVTPYLFAFVPTFWLILILIKFVSGIVTKAVNNEGMLISQTKHAPTPTEYDNLDLAE